MIASLEEARREVFRARRALAAGSPPKFWEWRLLAAIREHEGIVEILREAMDEATNRAAQDGHQ